MEVKQGYKLTEVGFIPEDWDECRLGDGVALFSGHHVLANYCNTRGLGVPYITGPADFPDGVIAHSKFTERPSTLCKTGDILVTVKGSGAGSLVIADASYCISRQLMAIRVLDWDKSFVFYSLLQNASRFKAASTGLIPGLSRSDINDQLLPLPKPPEQHTISEALSDMDALLGALDRLIAKKRDLKQAAMQQLLTGQTRLPGFQEEWKPKKFAELLKYERPDKFFVRSSDYEKQGDIPVLTANKSFILGYTDEKFGICENLPVIIFDDFTTDSKYVDFPFKVKSSAIKILKVRSAEVNLKFISERMRLVAFPVGEHKRYYISEYQDIELPTPEPAEQTAINSVLSGMDAELATLEQRREKTRALKQAMMQELLTGRTRLVTATKVQEAKDA